MSRAEARMVANSFHRRAAEYDRHVLVQKRVVETLLSSLETTVDRRPQQILDVGSGTGALLPGLHALYPAAGLTAVDVAYNMCLQSRLRAGNYCRVVLGDAQQLPFKAGSFDVVVSSSALQWVGDLAAAIRHMQRVLKPGGLLTVAFFCDGTLKELHSCFREVAGLRDGDTNQLVSRLHSFRSCEDLTAMLGEMDFDRYVVTVETEIDWYDDLTALLRAIKSIGAGPAAGGSGGGLGWRGVLTEASRLYHERYAVDGRIPASYQVLYLHARLPESTASR